MTFLLFKTVFDLNWFGRPNIYQEHLLKIRTPSTKICGKESVNRGKVL